MAWSLIEHAWSAPLTSYAGPTTITYDNQTQGEQTTASVADPLIGLNVPEGPAPDVLPVNSFVAENQHQDYHFRMWLIPPELRLSNPTINTDIPFLLWNTLRRPQTVTNVLVNGSDVLTFDLIVGNTVRDSQLRTVNLQIGPGEPNIDAIVQFVFTDTVARLPVIATVSETFNLVPDVPIRESWKYLTDIITNENGQEQRFALRRYPRRDMTFTVDILDLKDREQQYQLLYKNMGLQAIIPAYHHATNITQNTEPGGTKYFFNPALTQMRVGESLVVINPQTENANIATVVSIEPDGAIVGSAAGEQVTPAWYVYPAHSMVLRDGSGLTMSGVTGKLDIDAQGFSTPEVIRPGYVPDILTLDGMNIMDRRPLVEADENFSFRIDRIDYQTGIVELQRRGDPHAIIDGEREWRVSRYENGGGEEDFFRAFIDQARGAHKAWLLPTFFPDLTYVSGATPLSGQIAVEELDYPALFFPYETWKRVRIEYANLPPSYHTVQSAVVNPEGTLCLLNLSPVLADDVQVGNITRISYLNKVRGSDTVQRTHFALESFYKWAIKTVDD